ncbi:hypothetical protein LSAT2_029264, partial [Lamellibrachia satsuma]
ITLWFCPSAKTLALTSDGAESVLFVSRGTNQQLFWWNEQCPFVRSRRPPSTLFSPTARTLREAVHETEHQHRRPLGSTVICSGLVSGLTWNTSSGTIDVPRTDESKAIVSRFLARVSHARWASDQRRSTG